jgi:multisubunit Na+/H+ antiporter MnhB subunit
MMASDRGSAGDRVTRTRVTRVLAGILTACVGLVLVAAMFDLSDAPGGLTVEVEERLEESGVSHPVTAVLLNFRAYDTWLEIGVLVLAAIGLLTVRRMTDLSSVTRTAPRDVIVTWIARLLVPLMVLTAGFLLLLGTRAPGGAFQAGAVLGAAGVILRLGGYRSVTVVDRWRLRAVILLGFAVFLAVAAGVMGGGRAMLEFPPGWAGVLILIVETTIAISIAAILTLAFTGADPTTNARLSLDPGDMQAGRD